MVYLYEELLYMKFRLTKEHDFNIISIEGNMETEKPEVKELELQLLDLIKKDEKNFIFNMSGLQYLDSAGISIFIDVIHYSHKKNGVVDFVVKDPNVKRILSLVGLNQLVKIYDDISEISFS